MLGLLPYLQPFALIDPQGPLAEAALSFSRATYLCPAKRIGHWNPLEGSGDISIQVQRRVSTILKSWGEGDSEARPRLYRWLYALTWLAIENKLCLADMAWLINNPATLKSLAEQSPMRQIAELCDLDPWQYLNHAESSKNRLIRYSETDIAGQFTAFSQPLTGNTILDLSGLDSEHQRTLGQLFVAEMYERAMSGTGEPCHLILDEAPMMATQELANSLDRCRQKGLRVVFAFQRLGQWEPPTLNAILNSARNQIVFNVPHRPDAETLVRNLFGRFDEPETKSEIHRSVQVPYEDTIEIEDYGESEGLTDYGEASSLTKGTRYGRRIVPITRHYTDTELASESFYTIEEKVSRLADVFMSLGVGQFFVKTPTFRAFCTAPLLPATSNLIELDQWPDNLSQQIRECREKKLPDVNPSSPISKSGDTRRRRTSTGTSTAKRKSTKGA